jgi:4'-phosphopantetheinyl transferase
MPVLFQDIFQNGSIIGIWQITEAVEELLSIANLTFEENENLKTYKHENRKKHWLSYRVLLHELIGYDHHILYSDFGKPFLKQQQKLKHLSITHSGEYSAVIINDRNSVGVDMEKVSARIERVSERFLSDDELNFIETNNRIEHLTVCWTAKEALFKIHGNLCYDFKKEIIIMPFKFEDSGKLSCSIITKDETIGYKVYYRKFDSYFLAYVTA